MKRCFIVVCDSQPEIFPRSSLHTSTSTGASLLFQPLRGSCTACDRLNAVDNNLCDGDPPFAPTRATSIRVESLCVQVLLPSVLRPASWLFSTAGEPMWPLCTALRAVDSPRATIGSSMPVRVQVRNFVRRTMYVSCAMCAHHERVVRSFVAA